MGPAVVYYSFTGKTKSVAIELASQLGADLIEASCPAYDGLFGKLRQAWDVISRGRPPIRLEPMLDARDLIVVGAPVWGAKAAPPILSTLLRIRGKSGRIALFVTCDGSVPTSPPEPALDEMEGAIGCRVLTKQVFRKQELKSDDRGELIREFADDLKFRMSVVTPLRPQAVAVGRSSVERAALATPRPSGTH